LDADRALRWPPLPARRGDGERVAIPVRPAEHDDRRARRDAAAGRGRSAARHARRPGDRPYDGRGARLRDPFGIARLPDGDLVVSSNDSIFRVDAQSGQRETLATYPSPIEAGPLAVDSSGLVYVATTDHRITRINPATRAVEVVAGTGASGSSGDGGPALAATMTVPHGLILESDTSLLIADTDNDRIRRVDLRSSVITTVASGVSGVAMLARAADGSLLASELRGNDVVRIAADGSRTTAAHLAANPWSIAVTPDGTLYVIDSLGATLNRVAPNGQVTRVRVVAPA
jgi:sugar lactone lactonase YvrE